MAQSDQNATTASLRDYWRVVWLRRRLIIAIVIICTLLAFGRAFIQPDVYEATASLMYNPPPNVANATSGNSTDLSGLNVAVQSVANTIDSPATRKRAASLLSASERAVSSSVSATIAVPENASSGTAVADVVDVTATAGTAEAAAAVANAYAKAVIELRKESEQESWQAAQEIIQRQLDLYQTSQSKLTADYAVLSQQLRNLQIAEASANGDFEIIVPATPPSSPSSPKPIKSAIFGFVAGLFLGVVVAFVVAQFDTRVRSHRAVSEILGLPVIGRVPRISRKSLDAGGLVALTHPGGSVSEALRVLSRNLEWSGIDGSLKSIVATSFVKGEGKTLTLCNLAATLARAGKKVVVVDADLRDPKVHRVFNIPNTVGLTSVAFGRQSLHEGLKEFRAAGSTTYAVRALDGIEVKPSPNPDQWPGSLHILTSGPLPPNPGEVVASKSVMTVLEDLAASDADYVLVDAPPILGFGDAGSLSSSVDGILVIVRIDNARRPVLEEGRESLESMPGRTVGLVVVGERLDETKYASYTNYSTGQ